MRARGYQQLPSKESQEDPAKHGVTTTKAKESIRQAQEPTSQGQRPFKISDYRLEDESYDLLKAKPPIGSICIAIILTLLGIACFVLAWLHVTQRLLGKEQAEIGFTFIGLLTFIPGAYHTWIAYCVWRRVPGYSWDMIPN